MYKIILNYVSWEKGVYTREEETATNEYFCDLKYKRMIDRWLKILFPYVDMVQYISWLDCEERNRRLESSKSYKDIEDQKYINYLQFISDELEISNKRYGENKSFSITILEI